MIPASSHGSRRLVLTVASAIALLAGCVRYVAAPDAGPRVAEDAATLTRRQREAIVGEIDAAVRRDFAHWAGAPGIDYAAHLRAYRDAALALPAEDRFVFDTLSMAFLAALGNGHTGFNDQWLWRTRVAPLPFRLRRADSGWVVTESRLAELPVGALVTAADDEPMDVLFARARRYMSASSAHGARASFTGFAALLLPRDFVLAIDAGQRVTVRRELPAARAAGVAAPAARPDTLVGHRWLVADSVAYLRIACFDDPRYQDESMALLRGRYARAAGVVIDVRNNCGGSSPLRLVSLLADRPWPWWRQYDAARPLGANLALRALDRPELDAAGRPRAQRPGALHLVKPRPGYRGRLVILANEGCASACEDFLMPLAWSGRAIVVGDTTWGSSGQPLRLDFGGGMTARVSTRREFFPDGSEFEGVGIAPDLYVPRSIAAIRARRDPPLDSALAIVRDTTRKPRPRG